MRLIYEKTGAEVRAGDIATSFRGEQYVVQSVELPRHAGSTGRMYVTRLDSETDAPRYSSSYFPSVFGAKWVEQEIGA